MSKTNTPSLFLSGDINEETLMKVLPFLFGNKNKAVQIFICSHGGDSRIGLEIHKLFKAHGKVTCIAVGYCCSIATIIMLGANKKQATIDTEFLIHYGNTSFSGRAEAAVSLQLNKTIDKIYLSKLDIDRAQLNIYNNSELPILFDQAKAIKIIDGEYKL